MGWAASWHFLIFDPGNRGLAAASGRQLAKQYRDDASEVCQFLPVSVPESASLREDVSEIRRLLDEGGPLH